MPQDIKQLTGRMNTDDSEDILAPGDHAMSYDLVFRGDGNNMRPENVKGNTLITNSLPTGTNICIGAKYDDRKQRLFYFNYNSYGDHAIYIYYLTTMSVTTLLAIGAATDGDVLAFDPAYVIPEIDIIYGDDEQGDILYWPNSQKQPCKINIDRALGTLGSYGTVQRSYLNVIKAPPQIQPAVTFEDDSTVTVNNFRKKLMKFKYRYVYDDQDKSVWSAHSEIPLPIGYTDSSADLNADPTRNSRVAIVLQTGKPNVKKIEIAATEAVGDEFSDFFLIEVLDKAALSIADDSLTSYRFFNDKAYTDIDVPESIQPFDEVPRETNAQALLNGNVLAYGGIREGYVQITADAAATADDEQEIKSTQYPFIFVATQSGNSGFGTGAILAKIIGLIPPGFKFHIYTTNQNITYTAVTGDTPTQVLTGLAAAAVTAGFTASSTSENVTITKTGEALQRVYTEALALVSNLVAQAMVWDLSDTTLTLTGLASQFYLFPVGSNFVLSGASTGSFNGTYTNILTSVVSGANLVLTFTTPTIVTADTSFTANVQSNPSIVMPVVYTGQAVDFRVTGSHIYIHDAASYLYLYQGLTHITIAGASTSAFNITYNVVSVQVSDQTGGENDLDIVVSNYPTGTNESFASLTVTINPLNTISNPFYPTDSPAYDWWSVYGYGEEYFDENGITMGVVTNSEQSVQTVGYNDSGVTTDVYLPKNLLSINHRPPLEAVSYHIVRTKNLTKSNFIQWISNATYKDDDFAYISIEVLNQYIVVNPQSNFLAWEFTPGDRIRFMRTLSGTANVVFADKDYEIQASLTDSYVNGTVIEGQLLKIALPTTTSVFDFGGGDWANYLIEVYTPAKRVGDGLDLYYEFSERYMVGNPGTATRYHQGMLQNQTANLSQPATFEFIKGDNYFAQRTLNVGNEIKYSVDNNTNTDGNEWFLGMTKISGFDVQDYTVHDQDFVATAGTIPALQYFVKVLNNSYDFRITGQIIVRVDSYIAVPGATGTFRFLYSPFVVGVPGTDLGGEQMGPFTDGQTLTFNIDTTVTRAAADAGTMSIVISNRQIAGAVDLDYTIVSGYLTITQLGQEYTVGIQNPNYSFSYESAVNANGRTWVVDANATENFNPVLMRYGLAYQQDTNINQVNRFYSTNFDEYDRSKGDIRRFVARERFMRVFQSGGVGQVGIYAQFISNANGSQQLIYSNQIITQNNIQYYLGEFGMGSGNTALCSNKQSDYFDDPVRGYELRVSDNGITPISKLYKGQFYISRLITPYNYTWQRPDGSVAKILKVYDFFEEEAITVMQSGTRANYAEALDVNSISTDGDEYAASLGGNPRAGDTLNLTLIDKDASISESFSYTATTDDAEDMVVAMIALVNASAHFDAVFESLSDAGYIITTVSGNDIIGFTTLEYADAIAVEENTFSFNEKRNMYSSFFHYHPEWIINCEDTLFSWLDGELYVHDNETRANFYGTQYVPSIDLVFNSQIAIRKNFLALSYQSNSIWAAPANGDIKTSMINPQTGLQQISSLKTVDFVVQGGLRYASLKYDANSRQDARYALLNGDQLDGQWLRCNLQYPGTTRSFLYVPYVHFSIDGRNL